LIMFPPAYIIVIYLQGRCKTIEKILGTYGVLSSHENEYYAAVTPPVRRAGNRLSGLTETAYASLLA
jgi:hypothetical protein